MSRWSGSPISAGAKISMDSGVENMDWIARVLRRLVEFTQAGGEVNMVVNGINVGAQPYWNAEATMLMHTRGILIMTPKAAMVLTGKRALDYSGSVSAEDNQGIGGYDRIMGFNGQAQYFARDIDEACHILMRHYEHTYVAPGERFPRRAETQRSYRSRRATVSAWRRQRDGFARVGDIFSDETNPGRKKSFDIRKVMMAVVRPGPCSAGALVGHAVGRDGRGLGCASRRLSRVPDRHRIQARPALRIRSRRRSGPMDRRYAVPAFLEEGGSRHQRGQQQSAGWSFWPICPDSMVRRNPCAVCNWNTALRSDGPW